MSFWAPNLIENVLGSTTAMGLVLSFSSLIGLAADLILPNLMKNFTVRRFLIMGALTSFIFALSLMFSLRYSTLIILLFAMAIWGVYYEFLGFGTQEFIANSVPLRMRSSSWAFLSVFRTLAYFLGPFIGAWLLFRGNDYPAIFSMIFTTIGLFLLLFIGKARTKSQNIALNDVHILLEVKHWAVLSRRVWPVIIMSLLMGTIDAFFWSVGAVWTEELRDQNVFGGLFLSMYTLPSIFMGFVVTKWGIYQGKKKMAEKFLLLSGLGLTLLFFSPNVYWQLAVVCLSSLALSVVYPLIDATYTDIVARMGKEKKHLIGLSNSVVSLAYIIGPAAAGFAASQFGEQNTFVFLGALTAITAFFLIKITPKKLKLPQEEIKTWS